MERALELFQKKGYHGTSTTDICESLGISRPTLYWYFKDKEDILFSLHMDKIENKLQPLLDSIRHIEDPSQILKSFIRKLTFLVCSVPESKVVVKEKDYLAPEHIEWVNKVWEDQFHIVREAIKALKKKGLAKDVSETFAAFGLIGMIVWAYNWFDTSRPEGIEELADTIEEIFLNGILKTGAP